MIAGFALGLICGASIALSLCHTIIKGSESRADRWFKKTVFWQGKAFEWKQEAERDNNSHDDADWWKKG